jgi:hypothetical protein
MKKNILHLHYNLLNRKRREVFTKLKSFKEGILVGGTALFLQIGHRLSFDLDIFFEREIKRQDLLKLKKLFKIKTIELNTPDQLNLITSDNVRITLVHYPYKPLFKLISTISLPLLSVKDIALDKAFTIGRRPLWRDYVDLFFILKEDFIDIATIIKSAQKKFGIEFNERLFLNQVSYFKDLKATKISFVAGKYSFNEIKDFLERKVKEYRKLRFKKK